MSLDAAACNITQCYARGFQRIPKTSQTAADGSGFACFSRLLSLWFGSAKAIATRASTHHWPSLMHVSFHCLALMKATFPLVACHGLPQSATRYKYWQHRPGRWHSRSRHAKNQRNKLATAWNCDLQILHRIPGTGVFPGRLQLLNTNEYYLHLFTIYNILQLLMLISGMFAPQPKASSMVWRPLCESMCRIAQDCAGLRRIAKALKQN